MSLLKAFQGRGTQNGLTSFLKEHYPMVCANPIMVICPITPTVTDTITKMEVAHTVGHWYFHAQAFSTVYLKETGIAAEVYTNYHIQNSKRWQKMECNRFKFWIWWYRLYSFYNKCAWPSFMFWHYCTIVKMRKTQQGYSFIFL